MSPPSKDQDHCFFSFAKEYIYKNSIEKGSYRGKSISASHLATDYVFLISKENSLNSNLNLYKNVWTFA